ncbi:MAG: cobalamin-dependent protein [Thermoleophilia bacterium]
MNGKTLAQQLGDLEEAAVIEGVEKKLADDVTPLAILEELQAGMEIVGRRFENDEYFLSELIFGAEIFRRATEPLKESLEAEPGEKLATMVLGTVKNDIHDFGKDIVATVLSSNGVEVIDLGVNVEYEAFVEAIRRHSPQLVGISCLLTTVFEDVKKTVEAVEEAGLRDRVTILVGGGPVDQAMADYVGADVYCPTAQDAVAVARRTVGVS